MYFIQCAQIILKILNTNLWIKIRRSGMKTCLCLWLCLHYFVYVPRLNNLIIRQIGPQKTNGLFSGKIVKFLFSLKIHWSFNILGVIKNTCVWCVHAWDRSIGLVFFTENIVSIIVHQCMLELYSLHQIENINLNFSPKWDTVSPMLFVISLVRSFLDFGF